MIVPPDTHEKGLQLVGVPGALPTLQPPIFKVKIGVEVQLKITLSVGDPAHPLRVNVPDHADPSQTIAMVWPPPRQAQPERFVMVQYSVVGNGFEQHGTVITLPDPLDPLCDPD